MALDREAVFSALLQRLQDQVPGVAYFTRQFLAYDKVTPSKQPSLELVCEAQTPRNTPGAPPKWSITAWIVLYLRNTTTDPEVSPDTQLNELVRQVEAALEWQFGKEVQGDIYGATTLGGLVHHCWISGPVSYVQGIEGGQAWARIPLEILAVSKPEIMKKGA